MLTFEIYKGEEMVRAVSFDQPLVKIGRGREMDLCVSDDSIAKMQAAVEHHHGAMEVVNLHAGRPLLVNGAPVQRTRLGSGDRVQIGNTRMVVTLGGASDVQALFNRPSLDVELVPEQRGFFDGKRYELGLGEAAIYEEDNRYLPLSNERVWSQGKLVMALSRAQLRHLEHEPVGGALLRLIRPLYFLWQTIVVQGPDGRTLGQVSRAPGLGWLWRRYLLRDAYGVFARVSLPFWRRLRGDELRQARTRDGLGVATLARVPARTHADGGRRLRFGGEAWTLAQRAVLLATLLLFDFEERR
jgi:hypothetical protein